jgi:ankyrin repeat protein
MSKQEFQAASENFSEIISDAIIKNNDELLIETIDNNRNEIDKITDHKLLLNLAVSKKSTHTFALLIDYGFDPKKGFSSTPNPVAFAAKTQGYDFLSRYCETISKAFDPELKLVECLINEKDDQGKNALSYALEGGSYLGAVRFLIDNGADITENFLHNAKLAIENRHVKTLELMMRSNDGKVTEDQLSELSKHAKEHNNHIVQNVFAVYAVNHKFYEVKKEIDFAIDSHKMKLGSGTDIFEICRKGSLEDLEVLLEVLEVRHEKLFIDNPYYDSDGNSALFHALSNNCYDLLVSRLIDEGAIITNLTTREELIDDALTFCILKKEPKTLATILKSQNLDIMESDQEELQEELLLGHQKFSKIVEEMLSSENSNAVIVESFFTNISDFRLRNMEEETLVNLVKKSLEYAPEAAAEKLRKSFSKAVEDSSLKFVEIILKNFSKSDLTTSSEQKPSSRKSTRPINEERIGLLETRTASSSYYGANAAIEMTRSNNSSQQVTCDELFETALKKINTNSQSHNESDSREILILLLKKGIEPSDKGKMARVLEEIGITEQDYKSPSQSICAKFCSVFSNVLNIFGR